MICQKKQKKFLKQNGFSKNKPSINHLFKAQPKYATKSADSSACWDQSRPADQPTSRPTDLQTSPHLSTIHTRPSNPDETTSSLLLWGKPYAIFLRGRGGGRCSTRHLTDQHPDKNHHEIRLYASYRAENWSIHIKTITCNVWNQSKPFKIASNMSFDTNNTPKSSKTLKNLKNHFSSTYRLKILRRKRI